MRVDVKLKISEKLIYSMRVCPLIGDGLLQEKSCAKYFSAVDQFYVAAVMNYRGMTHQA